MRIAVFGADGQLGTDVVEALSDHDVARCVEPGRGGGVEVDITDASAVSSVIASRSPEWVINAAAMTNVDQCEVDVAPAIQVNAVGARNVASACAATGATLVHISTDYVFDGEKGSPYIESDTPHPVNVYGMSKLVGEWLAASECESHYIIRTSGLYGTNPCVGKGTNFVETMLRLAQERPSIAVVDDEVLTPSFTEDLAGQICALIGEMPPFGLYHATNGGECSWYEFAREIFRLSRVSVELAPISSKEWGATTRRPPNSVLENAAFDSLGCNVMPDWHDALSRYVAKRRPEGR